MLILQNMKVSQSLEAGLRIRDFHHDCLEVLDLFLELGDLLGEELELETVEEVLVELIELERSRVNLARQLDDGLVRFPDLFV